MKKLIFLLSFILLFPFYAKAGPIGGGPIDGGGGGVGGVGDTVTLRIADPENSHIWIGRTNPSFPFWYNNTGFSFIITEIYAISDTDNYDFNIFESNSATDMSNENDVLVDLVECETDGTECYTDTETTITAATIESDHALIWEHAAGVAGDLLIVITGYFDGDID